MYLASSSSSQGVPSTAASSSSSAQTQDPKLLIYEVQYPNGSPKLRSELQNSDQPSTALQLHVGSDPLEHGATMKAEQEFLDRHHPPQCIAIHDDHPKAFFAPPKLEILIHESQEKDQTASSYLENRSKTSSVFLGKQAPLFLAREAANFSSRTGGKLRASVPDMDCRVCHTNLAVLSSECGEAMELGCACKEDLGVAHRRCAEAWFKIKGNRICEICGVNASNVTGIKEVELINYLQERDPGRSSGEQIQTHWWSRIPLCNLGK